MRRCQDGRLTRPFPFPPDPDMVEELVSKVTVVRAFDVAHIAWQPPEELLAQRLSMKLFLARYGRVDPFAWESRDVNELRDHHAALVDLLKRESAVRTGVENE